MYPEDRAFLTPMTINSAEEAGALVEFGIYPRPSYPMQ
jgi:hypothetical protein